MQHFPQGLKKNDSLQGRGRDAQTRWMWMKFNFSYPLGMTNVMDKYTRVRLGTGKVTRLHPRPIVMPIIYMLGVQI